MKIKEIIPIKNCEDNSTTFSIFLLDAIGKKEILQLSAGKKLIYTEDFPITYFKIITKKYTIRGAAGTNRITIKFNDNSNIEQCRLIAKELIV